VAVVVRKVIALVFQRIAGFIVDFPPGSSSPHALIHVALTHADVGHPTPGLALGSTNLPILDAMDAEVGVRGMERQVMDKAEAMDEPYGAVVALIRTHMAGVLRDLDLLE